MIENLSLHQDVLTLSTDCVLNHEVVDQMSVK
jgi:hypothetical protein